MYDTSHPVVSNCHLLTGQQQPLRHITNLWVRFSGSCHSGGGGGGGGSGGSRFGRLVCDTLWSFSCTPAVQSKMLSLSWQYFVAQTSSCLFSLHGSHWPRALHPACMSYLHPHLTVVISKMEAPCLSETSVSTLKTKRY